MCKSKSNIETQEIRKISYMTPPKLNNSTVTNTNDNEVDETSKN
jgi:hypothetical protein